ncbi:MAG TPA: S41 family peptidase [Fimbriimonas sp.]|nr:S41 family peptidase [Fimbriimonas sp.]
MLGTLATLFVVASTTVQDQGSVYADLVDKGYSASSASKHADAVAAFKRALAIHPEDGNVWAAMAQAAVRGNLPDDVIVAADGVLKYGAFGAKVRAQAYFEIACAYCAKNEPEKAWQALNSAMDAGFRSLETVRTDKRLDLIRSHKGFETLAATKDVKKMSRVDGWKYDLWLLDRELRRIHKSPYLMVSKSDRDKWVGQIRSKISKLSDDQIKVELFRYVASFGDGHTRIQIPNVRRPRIQLFWFPDGIRVTAAAPEHKELVGSKVLAVESAPINELITKVEPLISHENPQGIKANTPNIITNPAILNGLGYKASIDEIKVRFERADGTTAVSTLPLSPSFVPQPDWTTISADNQPLCLQNRTKNVWFKHLPDLKAMYIAYNSVQNTPTQTIAAAATEIYKAIDESKVENIILDVRWNGGGNTFLSQPLINGLVERPKISQSGQNLFVITGRNTYSAAQNFTTDIGRLCRPIYVGEPTGSSPNFIGESIPYSLPYSGMTGTISDLYWQRSWPMDDRIWIAPEIPAPPSYQSFAQGKDPSLEAIKNAINTTSSNRS